MKRGRRDHMSKGRVKIMMEKTTKTAEPSKWKHTDSELTAGKSKWD